jgi:hypothetical protein
MNQGKTVFAQVMALLPHAEFQRCVDRYAGNYKVKEFTCHDQFLSMAFAQVTYRESLRDLVSCLAAKPDALYHMGIRSRPTRNNLANANASRDWRIYADLAAVLIRMAQQMYGNTPIPGVDISEPIYALDSTTIDLCLNMFPWARFRTTKAAVKLHTLLDLRCEVPTFIYISDGKTHDLKGLDHIPVEPGSYYVMDRGYLDFKRLYAVHRRQAFFVIRAKDNLDFRPIESTPVDRSCGLRSDQVIRLCGPKSRHLYPVPLRRVSYRDPELGKRIVALTNNPDLPPLVIAAIYKCRWQIESFFRWIKQNLRIRQFFGTSPNAVKTQVWIAVCVYVLAVMTHRQLRLSMSLSQMLQIMSITPFEKVPIRQLVTAEMRESANVCSHNQLLLNI